MRTLIIAIGCAFALAGSAVAGDDPDNQYRARRDSITPEVGNAVARNIAIQTVDPWPPNVRNPRIDINGEHAAHAIQRYRAGRATPPAGVSTQSVRPSGSGN